MSVSTIPRRDGVRIDAVKLDYELARRGITARQLAERAGVHEITLSRARKGGALTELNLQKIARALLKIRPLPGADLLIAEPEKKIPASSTSAGISKEVSRVSGATSAGV